MAGIPLGDLDVEFFDEIESPLELPGLGGEADDVAFGAERDDIAVGHGGDGAAHAVVSFDLYGIAEPPDFLTIGQ